jgi:hypothetical protein
LSDGPEQAPDRVVDIVTDRIKGQSQRPAWRLDWRHIGMSSTYKLAAAIASVAIVAVIGYNLLPGSSGFGGVGPTPTPVATAAPTPSHSPTAAPTPTLTPTPTPETGRLKVQGDAASWTAVIPTGWTRDGGGSRITASQGYAGPTGISVGASGAVNVPGDPCDGLGKFSDAKSPAEVVATLEARDDLVVSDPIDVTLGGYAGLRVDVELPADLSACGDNFYILFAEPDGSGVPALGPSNLFRIWILDVGGRPVVFWIERFAGTPAADMADAQRIMESIVIKP